MNGLLQLSGVIVDLVYRVEQVPLAGEEAIVSGFHMSAGGGFNAMVAARRSGMQVTYGGCLGSGPLADIVSTQLRREGISTAQSKRSDCDQGCCTVLVDCNGERTFIAKEGAEGAVSLESLTTMDSEDYDWILISGYALVYEQSRDAIAHWIDQLPADRNVVFDPCPLVASIPAPILKSILARSDWISCNTMEAQYLTGSNNAAIAAVKLADQLPGSGGAVVRQGESGCTLSSGYGKGAVALAGFAVTSIDTNGAGDSHVGTFIAALARGLEPQAACTLANAAAAISTTVEGPATTPPLKEVQAFTAGYADK